MRPFLWVAALLALSGVIWTIATRTTAIHFSGDLATDLRDAALRASPGTPVTPDHMAARVNVISVTDWDKLGFVPGAVQACGRPCSNAAPTLLVRDIVLTPRGVKKIIYLNIAPFLEDANSTIFTLSPAGVSCLERGLALEIATLSGSDWPDECLQKESAITRWKPGLF